MSAATFRKWIWLTLGLVAFAIPWLMTFEGLDPAGHRVLSIFLMAIVFWVSEAIPLHATAVLIIFLEILFISDRAVVPLPSGFKAPVFSVFYDTLAHPVLMLFLGGFFLAEGAAKYKLDKNLTRLLLKPFGTDPARIMLGLMLITAVLSMFMSNTATTATMMAVVLPVMTRLPADSRLRGGLALCIPVAANIGGIGTPVGTPPNAIALGSLAEAGITVTFTGWMLMMVPFMLIILILAWGIMVRTFARGAAPVTVDIESRFDRSRPAWILYVVFAITLSLWLTEPLHGIKSYIIGFFPVVALLCTGVFATRDMQNIQWHVLWLVAGGIALGVGVTQSGLDHWLIGLVDWSTMRASLVTAGLCLLALVMGTVISHSATANLLVPIGISLATSGEVAVSPVFAGVFIAVGASLAMALPISTPPNAIAYSTGAIQTRQMALVGAAIGLIGALLFVCVAPKVWHWLGLLPT